jgi:hypothetical protein
VVFPIASAPGTRLFMAASDLKNVQRIPLSRRTAAGILLRNQVSSGLLLENVT